MSRRLLAAVGCGLIGGALVAADAGRQHGYVATYHAAAALLVLVISVLSALVLSIFTRTRPLGIAVLFGGIVFYGTFVVSMTTLERIGVWDERSVSIGPATKSDLIVIFKSATDQELVNQF